MLTGNSSPYNTTFGSISRRKLHNGGIAPLHQIRAVYNFEALTLWKQLTQVRVSKSTMHFGTVSFDPARLV